jgi:pilus assembly protein CpaB
MGTLTPITRWVRRNRRMVAALCAAVAVLGLGMALRPPPVPTVSVVVAARDLPTGHRLSGDDVRVAEVAADLGPPRGGSDPRAAEGRTLAAPLAKDEPVTELRLVASRGGGWETPPGTVALPVRFTDPGAAALLSPGMRLELLASRVAGLDVPAAGGTRARLVAEGVLVVAIAGGQEPDAGILTSASSEPGSPLVVLAVTQEQALAIAGAQQSEALSFALPPGGGWAGGSRR